jgi:hypothetical protein
MPLPVQIAFTTFADLHQVEVAADADAEPRVRGFLGLRIALACLGVQLQAISAQRLTTSRWLPLTTEGLRANL